MTSCHQVALEIRAPAGWSGAVGAERLALLRQPAIHPDPSIRESFNEICEDADPNAIATVTDILTSATLAYHGDTPVLRYYCERYGESTSSLDEASWLVAELVELIEGSGIFMRVGEDPGDYTRDFFGPDESVSLALSFDQRIVADLGSYGIDLDIDAIRRILDVPLLDPESVRAVCERALPTVLEAVRRAYQDLKALQSA